MMEMDIMLAVLAIVGIVGYVSLFLGTAEPRHRHGNLFLAIVASTLIVMVIAGLFIQWPTEFAWQKVTAFYAIFGFCAFTFLIYAAKGLRLWLSKDEDYYKKKGV
jgi:putative Ca2+/H+ antiporter (TMEM165/GDT1 family)